MNDMRSNVQHAPAQVAERERVVVVYCRSSDEMTADAKLRACMEVVASQNLQLAHEPFIDVEAKQMLGQGESR